MRTVMIQCNTHIAKLINWSQKKTIPFAGYDERQWLNGLWREDAGLRLIGTDTLTYPEWLENFLFGFQIIATKLWFCALDKSLGSLFIFGITSSCSF